MYECLSSISYRINNITKLLLDSVDRMEWSHSSWNGHETLDAFNEYEHSKISDKLHLVRNGKLCKENVLLCLNTASCWCTVHYWPITTAGLRVRDSALHSMWVEGRNSSIRQRGGRMVTGISLSKPRRDHAGARSGSSITIWALADPQIPQHFLMV